jgi:hypothetical protein
MSRSMRRLGCMLAGALGVAACSTDVSSPTFFGAQGHVVIGLAGLGPNCMAAGADGVYWTDLGAIDYAPKSGYPPGASHISVESLYAVGRIAVDDESLYWTEIVGGDSAGGRIEKVSLPSAGNLVYETLYAEAGATLGNDTTAPFELGFLAVDQGTVYWTSTSNSQLSLNACGTHGCGDTPVAIALPAGAVPQVVRDGVLYFSVADAITTTVFASAALYSCPVKPSDAASAPSCMEADQLLFSSPIAPGGIVVDGGQLYFAENVPEGVTVEVCDLPYCTNTNTLFTGDVIPGTLAVHGGALYVGLDESLASCNVADCAAGPQVVDLPFGARFLYQQLDPAPTLVAGDDGAYAYAGYTPPDGSTGDVGPESGLAIVYIPPP